MKNGSYLTLRYNIDDLPRLHERVDKFCQQQGFGAAWNYRMRLVCEELFVNIVDYSGIHDSEKNILLRLLRRSRWLHITFIDQGKAFNPLMVTSAVAEEDEIERDVGGLGVFLVKKWADKLYYKRFKGRNIFLTTKKIKEISGKL